VTDPSNDAERVVSIRRLRGGLCRIRTSKEREFLLHRNSGAGALLEEGAELDGKSLEELEGPIARAAGLAFAYGLLSRRDRSERELREALAENGVGGRDVIDGIIGTLKRQGYVNDERLASNFVGYAMKHKPSGPIMLRKKLEKIGVGADVIERVIEGAFPPGCERELAAGLARRRLDPGMDSERAARRIGNFLARRGFHRHIVDDISVGILRGELNGEDNGR